MSYWLKELGYFLWINLNLFLIARKALELT